MYIQERSLTCSITIRNTPSSQKRNVSPHTTPLREVTSSSPYDAHGPSTRGPLSARHRIFGTIVDESISHALLTPEVE